MTVPPSGARPAPVVFAAPFTDRSAWAVGRTSAYPPDGRNPGDNKLDQIGPSYGPTVAGVFRARAAGAGLWHTDLVSTEYAPGGFELLPGDEALRDLRRGRHAGRLACAVDVGARPVHRPFAARPRRGRRLRVPLHQSAPARTDQPRRRRRRLRRRRRHPGRPFRLDVLLGAGSVRWQVDGRTVYDDGKGVGTRWRAWLVVCISVSAGAYGHPAPGPGVRELSWQCTDLEVRRPGGGRG